MDVAVVGIYKVSLGIEMVIHFTRGHFLWF